MSNTVPLISSGVAGPLGVLHLPRFWQKVSLAGVGKLRDDYPACGAGFDQMTLDALGLDKDATINYIQSEKPSYFQFEAWVNSNMSVDADVGTHNAAVTGYNHDDGTRGDIFGLAGLNDDGCSARDAVNLNNYEDWCEFHKQEILG
ncbi:MAG: DUF5069 domain-containing protein [Opitutaceae bacterium]|nr:DUF5069 domain-containing protein [Opitutaceae bacterium]|tara:strand:- start:2273 stop:2710 length:438 start_codon:yes stop_codon:yes gene_type:complete